MDEFTAPKPLGTCFYCGLRAMKVIELRVSDMPPRGSTASRGSHNRSVQRRACIRHARAFLDLMERRPLESPAEQERRTGMDRRA